MALASTLDGRGLPQRPGMRICRSSVDDMCAQLYESNQPSKHYNKIRAAATQYSRIMPVEHVHPLVRTQKQLDRVLHEIEELVTSSCLRALRSAPPAKTRPVSTVHRPPPQAARLPSPPPLYLRSLSAGDASRRLSFCVN
jgi:hypothetical protein